MMVVILSIAVMVFATLATHLGLAKAIASVIARVMKCHKCLTFWLSIAVLLLVGCDIVAAMGISIISAYLSNWFGLLLVWLNGKYNELWQRINRKTKI